MPVESKYPFNPAFELACARQLIADPALLSRVAAHVKPERFSNPDVHLIIEEACAHFRLRSVAPTSVEVLQRIRSKVETGQFKLDRVVAAASALEDAEEQPPAESAYVSELLLGEARKTAVWAALDLGLKQYKTGDYEPIRDAMDRALQIGRVDDSLGVDLIANLEERTQQRRDGKEPKRIGTGIGPLDDVIRGGLGPGELGVIIGAPKFGKTMAMVDIARHVMSIGGNAFYFSMEMGERDLIDRTDAAIARVNINELASKADYVRDTVSEWVDEKKGYLYIKQLPSYDTTAKDIEAHMQMLRAEKSIVPTVMIADSGDLMSPSRDQSRHDLDLGAVYSELRAIGVKWKIPVWTCSWAKRDSLSKKVVTMADVSDSFRKVAISDVGIAICGDEEERQDGIVRLYVAWCRYATGGVQVGPFKSGFSEGRFINDDY